jgi:hypothetical protein
MRVIKPPQNIENIKGYKVFLAGSIEMGKAENWQSKLTNYIESLGKDIVIYNPRRDDWNPCWEQKISNDNFYNQVN